MLVLGCAAPEGPEEILNDHSSAARPHSRQTPCGARPDRRRPLHPDSAKEKPVEAEVIAVGNGKILEDGAVRQLAVKKGDKILFSKYSGSEVKLDEEEHLIMREEDILAVIEK